MSITDLLCVSEDPSRVMDQIRASLKLKNDKTEEPDFYLGVNLKKKPLNGKPVWTISSSDYLKAAIENSEKRLKKRGERLPSRATTPMMQTYKPEEDDSQELDSNGVRDRQSRYSY
jgi:hypothetical protein